MCLLAKSDALQLCNSFDHMPLIMVLSWLGQMLVSYYASSTILVAFGSFEDILHAVLILCFPFVRRSSILIEITRMLVLLSLQLNTLSWETACLMPSLIWCCHHGILHQIGESMHFSLSVGCIWCLLLGCSHFYYPFVYKSYVWLSMFLP